MHDMTVYSRRKNSLGTVTNSLWVLKINASINASIDWGCFVLLVSFISYGMTYWHDNVKNNTIKLIIETDLKCIRQCQSRDMCQCQSRGADTLPLGASPTISPHISPIWLRITAFIDVGSWSVIESDTRDHIVAHECAQLSEQNSFDTSPKTPPIWST